MFKGRPFVVDYWVLYRVFNKLMILFRNLLIN